jgi:hypothetical protein
MKKPTAVNAWYGWVPDRPDQRDQLYSTIAAPPRTLPRTVDLRPTCAPVEDQGQLGSCTANALVGNLEFPERKAGKRVTDLSRLFVYYNERALEGTINEDAGAMIRDGVKTLVKLGVCTEKKWGYDISKLGQRLGPAGLLHHALRLPRRSQPCGRFLDSARDRKPVVLVRALRRCRCFRVRCYDGNDGLPNSARCTPENPVLVAFSRRFTARSPASSLGAGGGAAVDCLASSMKRCWLRRNGAPFSGRSRW